MIDNLSMRRALNQRTDAMKRAVERQRLLANFYSLQRNAGMCVIEACEAMSDYDKRLDEAEQRVADDKFNRDLAVIRSVMARK